MNSKVITYTTVFVALLIAFDLIHAWRNRNKITSAKSASKQLAIYIFIAIIFGLLMRTWTSAAAQEAYFASWITEYSLSLDNLFVFIVLFKRLRIPQEKQEVSLFFGITLSLFLRAICLIVGVAILNKFAFVNFFFAALLAYTAFNMQHDDEQEDWHESKFITKLREKGISGLTLALYAIALTDLMFAFDSIPAVLGVTNDIYVILTSNFMALIGLRQLYFLVERLVVRLYYLSAGIAIILFFISFKLVVGTLEHYSIKTFFGLELPVIDIHQSLIFIAFTLAITTALSFMRKPESK